MFKANTGYSTGASAFDAGKEAAAQAVEGLDAPKVAFVYCSCDYNVTAVVDGVKEAIPGVPVLGNTSFTGVIVSDGGYVGGDEPFVGVMVLSSRYRRSRSRAKRRSLRGWPHHGRGRA